MTPFELHMRVGGVWVPSDAEGAARLDGVSEPFGPPATGTVDEYLDYPPPFTSDWPDTDANVGVRFAVSIAGEWIGNRVWRSPTFVSGQQVYALNDDTGAVIAGPDALPGSPIDAYVVQLFTASVAVVPGVNYIAAYRTDRYGFTRPSEGAVIPFASDHIYTDGVNMSAVAKYQYGAVPPSHPWASSPNFHYHVSPVVRFPA